MHGSKGYYTRTISSGSPKVKNKGFLEFAGLFVPSRARLFVTLSQRGYLYGHLWDQDKRLVVYAPTTSYFLYLSNPLDSEMEPAIFY